MGALRVGVMHRVLSRVSERLDRAVLGLEQALLLGDAINEPEGHLVQLLCTEALQLFGVNHEHAECRPSV